MFEVYNHNSIYRAIIAVMDAFSDVQIDRVDPEGNVRAEHTLPIMLGHQSVSIARNRLTERTSPNIRTILPRLGLEITGLERETEAMEDVKNYHVLPGQSQRAGVPYRLRMRLTLYFKYIETGLQIVEAITSQFTPDYFIHMFQAPSIMRAAQTPLNLDRRVDLDFGRSTWVEGKDRGDNGILKAHFDISMVLNMWPPTISDGGIIHDVCLNMVDLQTNLMMVQQRWQAFPNTTYESVLNQYTSQGSLMVSDQTDHTLLAGTGVYKADICPTDGFYLEWTGNGSVGLTEEDIQPLSTPSGNVAALRMDNVDSSIVFGTAPTLTITPPTASPPIRAGLLVVPDVGTYRAHFIVEHAPVEMRHLGGQVFVSSPIIFQNAPTLTIDVSTGNISVFSEQEIGWLNMYVKQYKTCPDVLLGYKDKVEIPPMDVDNHTKILTHVLDVANSFIGQDLSESDETSILVSGIPNWVPNTPGVARLVNGEYIFYDEIVNNTLLGITRGALGTIPSDVEENSTIDFIKPSIIQSQKFVNGEEV